MIEDVVKANNLNTVEDVTFYTKAGGGCAACEGIEEILAKVMAEACRPRRSVAPARLPGHPEARRSRLTKLTLVQKIKKIEEVLDVRPMLQRDHGDVELADVQGKKIYVYLRLLRLHDGSGHLGGIQQKMIEALGELVQILPSSHIRLRREVKDAPKACCRLPTGGGLPERPCAAGPKGWRLRSVRVTCPLRTANSNPTENQRGPCHETRLSRQQRHDAGRSAVVEAMLPFFTEHFGNASSIHAFGSEVGKALKKARSQVQACLAPSTTRRSSSPPAAPNPIPPPSSPPSRPSRAQHGHHHRRRAPGHP